MKFSLTELARILSLQAAGKRVEALAAFGQFESLPSGLPMAVMDFERDLSSSLLDAVLLRSPYGQAWICYQRSGMRTVKRPGRLSVIPLLELRDLLKEVRDG